ncbi:ricin-type beta-trefoil lectin domain protein [Streptomyces sp. BK239]|uniref:ricin-type beta-trefoil lectin domain protein n=1 Tax=Streptomyces sp. BK239 TaxID=2512155 RepID=UPI00102CA029|nr:ricin-type beta-trefoil lectin domain protein [Streptomyces sp. BK239]RZU17875.1 ricin-type beta-trefoil lectin protein [Streptomyces sp. BK239]
MPSANPPRPPFPPRPGHTPGDSDRDLAARLGTAGNARAVALLLIRHWQAAHDYATVCLAGHEDSARLVAAAAFHEVFGMAAGGRPGGALRPQLLVAVRNTVRDWAGKDAMVDMLPELRKPVGARGLRAARPGTPERRQLTEHAFRSLPTASQYLLWHTEVEAEPITIPAGLLGVDAATAQTGLERARMQFHAACVRAHRELAPSAECHFHNRLLDVPPHDGGTLLPDAREHLADCRHCRHTAEQLSHFEDALDILLAETVLGWGARRYLESRPGRATAAETPALPAPVRPADGGRHHRTTSDGVLVLPGRRRRAALAGVGLTAVALLATVFVTNGPAGDGHGGPNPRVTWGAPAGGPGVREFAAEADGGRGPAAEADGAREFPGVAHQPAGSSSTDSPASSVPRVAAVAHGRLRSAATGLCLDTEGGLTTAGTPAVLATCSSAASQRWSYGADGLLRSAAAPVLCLTADLGRGRAALSGCAAGTGEALFDLTARGELLLRRDGGVLATGAGTGAGGARTYVAVMKRDGSVGQRWVFDAGEAQTTPVPGGGTTAQPPSTAAPQRQEPPARPSSPGDDAPATPAAPVSPDPDVIPGHGGRFAQVDCCRTLDPKPTPDPRSEPAPPGAVPGGVVVDRVPRVGALALVPPDAPGSARLTRATSAFGH